MNYTDTFSITFAERVENHKGMQMIGELAETGLNEKEFDICVEYCNKENLEYELVDLTDLLPKDVENEEFAKILIIRNGIDKMLGEGAMEEMYKEQKGVPCDKMAFMRGKVVNKRARWNNCYADFDQEPNYKEGKGTVVNFSRVEWLKKLRERLPLLVGEKGKDLYAEMNYYYDLKKTYIGFHGDSERKIVICARLGASMNLYYGWYHRFKQIGDELKLSLNGGDIYIMSQKATGNDWKKSSKYTLRHAAAADYKLVKKKTKK